MKFHDAYRSHSVPSAPPPPPFPRSMIGGPISTHNGSVPASNMPLMNSGAVTSRPCTGNLQQDLATQLAETIAQATSLIQAAGLSQQSK